jgi:hypothetical protein
MQRLPDYILLKPTLTLCLICLCLFGCTSMPPTSYQAAQISGDNGFSHVKLSNNQYRVLFSGNKTSDETTVKDYALLHAAELTQQQGFDWFVIVDSDTEVETKEVTRVGPVPITQVRGGTTCGLLGCTTPSSANYAGAQVLVQRVKDSVLSSLLITMGKGQPETPLTVFDAAQLADHLKQQY